MSRSNAREELDPPDRGKETTKSNIGLYLASEQQRVDAALREYMESVEGENTTIHRAMSYSLFAGGKRFRPILVLAAGKAFGAEESWLMPAACAIEMIHTYSLIHDDLPALDNDNLRRGQPTSHRVFGEAIAILAGDALLTKAFQILAENPDEGSSAQQRIQTIRIIARACGPEGMIDGQVSDLEWSGREDITEEMLNHIHRGKTAALIQAAVMAGGLMAGVSEEQLRTLEIFGEKLGLAFQIIDDILDIVETSEGLGKTAGKDKVDKKATYPLLFGLEGSKARAQQLIQDAIAICDHLGESGVHLKQLAEFVALRRC